MTLVDLPGLVGLSSSKEKDEQHKMSYSIVKEYLKDLMYLFYLSIDLM